MLPHAFRVTTGPVTKFAGPQSTKGTLMRRAALFLLVGVLAGCGDDGGNTPTSPAPAPTTTRQPPPPRKANILLDANIPGVRVTDQGNGVLISLRLVELGGVGATINFIRLDVFRATGFFEERQELSGARLRRELLGRIRIEANSRGYLSVIFWFRATVKRGRGLEVTVGLTDDNGNVFELSETFVFT